MEDRKRTLLAVIIACVVVLAVLYSFGLNLFSPRPQLILADPEASSSQNVGGEDPGNQGGIPVELTVDTVQRVVADLARYSSYSRTVVVTYYWGDGSSGSVTADVWVHNGWTRTSALLPSGMVEHSVVGDGQFWLWFDRDTQVHHGPTGELSADLMQRLPTYEDVLAMAPEEITAAGFVDLDGEPCVYVETTDSSGVCGRYWISSSSGLLMAAETLENGKPVYSMNSREVVSPLTNAASYFVLPDGTELLNPR